jgi:hypothetical protein
VIICAKHSGTVAYSCFKGGLGKRELANRSQGMRGHGPGQQEDSIQGTEWRHRSGDKGKIGPLKGQKGEWNEKYAKAISWLWLHNYP